MTNTTTFPRWPMPNTTAEAQAHLTSQHGWAAETSAADTALVQAHRFAHGVDGRPDLADSELDHVHGQTQPVQPMTQYPYPYAPSQRASTNGLAIASLVLGIVWLWWVGSLLAIIFGTVALRQIEKSGGTVGGRGLAIAGVVLGWVGFATFAFIFVVTALGSIGSSSGY